MTKPPRAEAVSSCLKLRVPRLPPCSIWRNPPWTLKDSVLPPTSPEAYLRAWPHVYPRRVAIPIPPKSRASTILTYEVLMPAINIVRIAMSSMIHGQGRRREF